MAETRQFHIGDILSVTTGHLVSPRHMRGIHDLLDFMTGDQVLTHQIPRFMDECAPSLREQFPDLAEVEYPDGLRGEAAVLSWLAEVTDRLGQWREVRPLDPQDHTHVDPIAEMRAMAPHAQVITIEVPPGDGDS